MLNCKKISTAIRRAEQKLVAKEQRSGLYENFGQSEIMQIKDKFIDSSDYSDEMNNNRKLLDYFRTWCSTYSNDDYTFGRI